MENGEGALHYTAKQCTVYMKLKMRVQNLLLRVPGPLWQPCGGGPDTYTSNAERQRSASVRITGKL